MELKEVKRLKKFIKEKKRENFEITYNRKDDFLKDLETVLQALEETTEERDMYLRQLNRVFDNGFISKKKIEDKIKYWEELMDNYCKRKEYDQVDIANYKIKVLQELLEDK